MSINRRTFADLVLLFEPEMKELIHLREEVQKLRFKMNPPTPTVHALIEDTPIKIKQDDDGRWSSTITTGPHSLPTGSGGHETDIACFKGSVRHLATLLGEEWSRRDEE